MYLQLCACLGIRKTEGCGPQGVVIVPGVEDGQKKCTGQVTGEEGERGTLGKQLVGCCVAHLVIRKTRWAFQWQASLPGCSAGGSFGTATKGQACVIRTRIHRASRPDSVK